MNKVELSEKLIDKFLDVANATVFANDSFMNAVVNVAAKLRIVERCN